MNPCKSTLKNSEITDQVDTKSSKPKKSQNMPLFFLFLLAEELLQGFEASVVSHKDSFSRHENFSCPSGWILGPTGMGCVLLQVAATSYVCHAKEMDREVECDLNASVHGRQMH